MRKAKAALDDERLTVKERIEKARRAARSTGRKRGRPRTDTVQHAIRALSLFYAKGYQLGGAAMPVPPAGAR